MKEVKKRRRNKSRKLLVELEEKILLFSSLAHILDVIINEQGLTEEQKQENQSVRMLGKLINKVTYLQHSALGILGETVTIQDSPTGQETTEDGGESLPE